MQPKIDIVNLYLKINDKIIFNNLNLKLDNKNIYALVGNNGSGKTTLFKAMLGFYNHCKHNIFFNNQALSNISNTAISINYSFLMQHDKSNSYCIAQDRIAHGLIPLWGMSNWLKIEQLEMIQNIAKRLHIEHLLYRSMNQLSGGEQRLINIAKNLVNPHVRVIIFDEPSVFLDIKQKNFLIEYLISICSKEKIIIFSSHDQDFINRCAKTIFYLENGQILQ